MSAQSGMGKNAKPERSVAVAGAMGRSDPALTAAEAEELLEALRALSLGDFSVRLAANRGGISGKIADALNNVVSASHRTAQQLDRVGELERRAFERTSELAAANAHLLQSERGRSLALAAGNMGSWQYDCVTASWHWDEAQGRIFGFRTDSAVSHPRTEELMPFFLEAEWLRLREAAASASPSNNTLQTEVTVLRSDGEPRHCLIAAAATFDDTGAMVRVDGVTIDITDRREAEHRQALLAREVDHRARNALAIVQSVIRLTRDQQSAIAFKEAVEGRVRALAKAHELLSQTRWQGGDILRLVREELAPYFTCTTQISVDGPPVVLPPDRAQTVALVLHELATNAMKYGALSEASGSVDVKWTLDDGKLVLRWVENTSHPVLPPSRNGVGTRIIVASAATTRGGDAKFDWRPEGLAFTLTVPLASPHAPRRAEAHVRESITRVHSGLEHRVLLVEDEAMTGLFMRNLLEDLGYSVVGPLASVEDALKAARTEKVCAALLDVNLRGSAIDPVAEILIEREIPVVLVTGYAREHIETAFNSVPVLRKPVAPAAVRALLQNLLAAKVAPVAQTSSVA